MICERLHTQHTCRHVLMPACDHLVSSTCNCRREPSATSDTATCSDDCSGVTLNPACQQDRRKGQRINMVIPTRTWISSTATPRKLQVVIGKIRQGRWNRGGFVSKCSLGNSVSGHDIKH